MALRLSKGKSDSQVRTKVRIMKTKKWYIVSIGIIVPIVLLILVFQRVPVTSEGECLVEAGVVANIYESGSKDITFTLYNNRNRYYVNRGLERGLNLAGLKSELVGRQVVIKYPKYWTPLDPQNKIRHIAKIEYDGETIFSEFDD